MRNRVERINPLRQTLPWGHFRVASQRGFTSHISRRHSTFRQGNAVARKLIIDVDPGIGDALAVLMALLDPDVEVLALTAVAGCVPGPVAAHNLQAILAQVDADRWPRVGQAFVEDQPLERVVPPSYTSLEFLNGPTGLGDCKPEVAELHHLRDSAKILAETVRAFPHQVTLLTLGPLQNVAAASERDPEFLGLLEGLVCLAGSVGAGGDVTASAEFNVFEAPEAARKILCGLDAKIIIPLDVTNQVVLTYERFKRLLSGSIHCSSLVRQLLPYAFRAHHEFLGIEGMFLREITALAMITQPQLFRLERMAVDVELTGDLTRGETLFDRRRFFQCPTNASVAVEVDAQGVLDYFTRIFKAD